MGARQGQQLSTNCTCTKTCGNGNLRAARSANTVLTLADNSLVSTSKFVDAGYMVVFDNKEVY
jgi:hypothetical protein